MMNSCVNIPCVLTGYRKDQTELITFFRDHLGYTCLEFSNCTHDQIFDAIKHTKETIRQLVADGKTPNRLVVAILSHGDVVGLCIFWIFI